MAFINKLKSAQLTDFGISNPGKEDTVMVGVGYLFIG